LELDSIHFHGNSPQEEYAVSLTTTYDAICRVTEAAEDHR